MFLGSRLSSFGASFSYFQVHASYCYLASCVDYKVCLGGLGCVVYTIDLPLCCLFCLLLSTFAACWSFFLAVVFSVLQSTLFWFLPDIVRSLFCCPSLFGFLVCWSNSFGSWISILIFMSRACASLTRDPVRIVDIA